MVKTKKLTRARAPKVGRKGSAKPAGRKTPRQAGKSTRHITEEKMRLLGDYLLEYGTDQKKNINALTKLTGKVLQADCALYNRLEGEILCSIGHWHTPVGSKIQDMAEGHICYDLIRRRSRRPMVVCNLPKTKYAHTDPNVKVFGLKTYAGVPVQVNGTTLGSLCVVYKTKVIPHKNDLNILAILAKAISIEESRRISLRKVQESEEEYRTLFEMESDALFLIDNESGQILEANTAAEKLYGYSRAQLLRLRNFDLSAEPEKTRQTVRERRPRVPVRWHRKKDGTVFAVEIAGAYLHWQGRPAHIAAIRDISERLRVEAELSDLNKKLEYILEVTKTGIDIIDADFNLKYVNPGWQKAYGEPSGRKCYEYFMGRTQACPDCAIPLALKSKQVTKAEHVLVRENNRMIEVHTIPYQGSDGHWLVAEFNIDITARKQAEEERLKRESRFRALIQGSSDIISIVDERGIITYVSPSCSRIIGYAEQEFIGKSPLDLVHPEDLDTARTDMAKTLSGEKTGNLSVYRIRKADGQYIHIESTISNLLDVPGINGIVTTARDISARIQEQENRLRLEAQILQAQKLESLGVLAGGIAHDFNNLLMAILGNLDLALLASAPSLPTHHNLEQAQHSAQRAAELIRQLLDYSGTRRSESEPLSLNQLVTEITGILEVSISKKARLHYHLADALPTLAADNSQIRQVIMNLVINASDALAGQSGEINITTGVQQCPENWWQANWPPEELPAGEYVFLEVYDSGCGMEGATIAKIYDPFFTTKFTGRGLGLAVVLGIIRSHRGAIQVESEPGQGSRFRVYFPASAQAGQTEAEGEGFVQEWQGSGTILLVDDEPAVSEVGKEMLEALNFKVITAKDGSEAIALLSQQREEIRCVLLDLTMPKMDGEETFRELRRLRPDIPIILCSGYHKLAVAQRFASKDFTSFLHKPYSFKTLRQKLMQTLEQIEKG